MYRGWQQLLPEEIQVCPIELPGRETRAAEPYIRRVSAMVEAMSAAVEPMLDELPYAIFGHSMGSLIGFEWAHSLREHGLPEPVTLYASGRCSPDTVAESTQLTGLPDAEFVAELQRIYAGIPPEIQQSPEALEYFLPILRADIELVESYRYVPRPPLNLPLLVFGGIDDPSMSLGDLTGWRHLTRGEFAAQLFPGEHFYDHAPLCAKIGAHLRQMISS